jgi:hypothetical protein
MAHFSDDQLTAIAQQFHDLSDSIKQFRLDRIGEGVPLDDPGIVQLLGLQVNIANTSSSFYVEAARLTLADADAATAQIGAATKQADAAIRNLQVVNRVISIASAAGVLATAIMTGDMSQIGNATKDVYTAISSNGAAKS